MPQRYVLPYVKIIMDIGSWWATRYLDPLFAYIVIAGGALMGLTLAAQILISLWEMWVDPVKAWLSFVRSRSADIAVARHRHYR